MDQVMEEQRITEAQKTRTRRERREGSVIQWEVRERKRRESITNTSGVDKKEDVFSAGSKRKHCD
jgi:hypothetical protein